MVMTHGEEQNERRRQLLKCPWCGCGSRVLHCEKGYWCVEWSCGSLHIGKNKRQSQPCEIRELKGRVKWLEAEIGMYVKYREKH